MTFLLGRQAMFGHDPPIYFRSTTAVRLPSLAIVQAANLPAVPPPSTTTSNFSTDSRMLDPLNLAAIHADGSACQPTSFLRYQVCHQAGNLLRFPITGDAGLFRKLL